MTGYKTIICFALLILLVGVVDATTTTVNVTYDAAIDHTTNGTWHEHRNGAGEQIVTNQIYLYGASTLSNNTNGIYDKTTRTGMSFNTSGVPDDETITSVNVTVWGDAYTHTLDGHSGMGIIDWTPASPTSFAYADYNKTTFTLLSNVITGGGYETTITNYTLNAAGRSYINKTG